MSQQSAKESIDRLKSAGIVSLSPSGNYTRAEMAENIIANCNQDRQDGASKDTSLILFIFILFELYLHRIIQSVIKLFFIIVLL